MNPIVFLIDDDDDIIEVLSLMLSKNGYTPITARNGSAALDLLKHSPRPSLIITDYAMPLLNGCEFTENISVQSEYQDVPVIIITGSDITGLRLPQTRNFRGVIEKPFKIGTFLDTIRRIIREGNTAPVIVV